MNGKSIARVLPPLVILVIALGMSLEGAHASIMSGMPYGESQPLNGGSSPSAYYYDGRTYVTWQGSALDPYVAYYTSATGTWTGPVRVGDNPLTNDDHGAPAILVDNSGYIHIMYGSHGTAQKYVKSTNPEDISAWTTMADPVNVATYPQLLKDSSGNIYMIYRMSANGCCQSVIESIIKSTNAGVTWSAPQNLIDVSGGEYLNPSHAVYLLGGGAEYESASNKIHLTWVRYNVTYPKRENVYYAYLNLNDNNMYSIDGTNLGSTIDQTEADAHCKVVNSGTMATNMARVRVGGTGIPYIIYEANTASGWLYNFTRWTGSAWSAPVSITSSNGGGGNEFFIHSSTNIEAYVSGSSGIERWSWDGSTWGEISTVLARSQVSYHLDFPMEVLNGVDLKIVFCEINLGVYTVSNLRIFAYDASELIVKRRS